MKEAWLKNIQAQCDKKNITFLFKQWRGWGQDGVKRHKQLAIFNANLQQENPENILQRINKLLDKNFIFL